MTAPARRKVRKCYRSAGACGQRHEGRAGVGWIVDPTPFRCGVVPSDELCRHYATRDEALVAARAASVQGEVRP